MDEIDMAFLYAFYIEYFGDILYQTFELEKIKNILNKMVSLSKPLKK